MADTIAVRPPEYFPGLAYFGLMQEVDRFVLADTFPYRRRSFQNRGKLRNPQGWQWITVPMDDHQHKRPIYEVDIQTGGRWLEKHWRAFQFNYRSTPYFEYFEEEVEPFFQREWTKLGELTCTSVELLHRLLDLSTPLVRATELGEQPDTLKAVLRATDATTLISPEDAVPDDQAVASVLQVVRYDHPTYRQNFDGFEPGMSAADVLFNYGPEARSIIAKGVEITSPDVTS